MQPKYEVLLIPQNLRRDETIVEIAEALQYLSDVSNDIFDRINKRIATSRKRIGNIDERIKVASVKVSRLTGAKKATQVFSSSKYPAVNVNKLYTSIFVDNKGPLPIRKIQHEFKNMQVKDEPLEPLQFFHVKVQDDQKKDNFNGLGELPKDADNVNDLLLFNSGSNPYDNFIITDTLDFRHSNKKEETKDVTDIGAAPLSISEPNTLSKNVAGSYFYTPDLGNVPTIDVPLDLPDLPGIADDLRYTLEPGPGIAPSVLSTPSVPDLPAIIPESPVQVPKLEEVFEEKPTNISKPSVEPVRESKIEIKKESVVQVVHEVAKPIEKVTVTPDARANLMEAIRQAGKSKNLKTVDTDKPNSKFAAQSGGDLMADLHAKLTMRRKGISGAKNSDTSSSAMDKISDMIPPPPIQNVNIVASDDDEWED